MGGAELFFNSAAFLLEASGIWRTLPMRKPTRIPFLTQALTFQPVGEAASGSAARMLPSFKPASTSFISDEGKTPTRSVKRVLLTVAACETLTADSLGKPVSLAGQRTFP